MGKTKSLLSFTGGYPAFLESDYARRVSALTRTGIIETLPGLGRPGVIGIDGAEYSLPALDQVLSLFATNADFLRGKVSQGFDRLELVPMAAPASRLMSRMQDAIVAHGAEGKIFRTGQTASGPSIPVRVNKEKIVWIWETLREAFTANELVYFPKRYVPIDHGGKTKLEALHDPRICAVPGWSIALTESASIMPAQGQGASIGGRKQIETGLSPNEYLRLLKEPGYEGETGKTLEDFITGFTTRLDECDEVSNDVDDNNAAWCLAHYLKISYADLVPTGRWHRSVGRVRLDMHRSNNKRCTKSFGAPTVVRLGLN
ncbi:MAG: hypothetical protein Q8O15_09770 [Rectinemataceae bacterium]|nr:hypothetical protein [Rectinemataceae bacterium]